MHEFLVLLKYYIPVSINPWGTHIAYLNQLNGEEKLHSLKSELYNILNLRYFIRDIKRRFFFI